VIPDPLPDFSYAALTRTALPRAVRQKEMTVADNEAPPWFTRTFDLDPTSSLVFVGGQTPTVLLRVLVSGYQYRRKVGAPVEQFVLVDLSNTTVSPGRMRVDKDDIRGAFTDRVDVKISFDDEPAMIVRKAGPDTTAEGGSASESMSFSVSGGFFGETPTANLGWSISSGVTRQLPDFEIQKDVGANRGRALEHRYRLRVIDGAVYNIPTDAVKTTGSGSIRRVPPKASHDLDIFSSVLFHTDTALQGKRRLRVHIDHRMVTVEKTYMLPNLAPGSPARAYDVSREDQYQRAIIGCALGWLKVDVTPSVAAYDWLFDIDLTTGDVDIATQK
jgi:hypothetical protein